MNEPDEVRTYMNAVIQELEDMAGPHPGVDALTAYQQARLSGSALAMVRDHLVACDECLALFRDIDAFFSPPQEGHGGESDVEIRGGWKALWRQVEAEKEAAPPAGAVAPRAAAPWYRKAWSPALAAGLVLVITLPVMWAVLSRQNRLTAAGELQLERREMAERLKQLEEQNRQLREQVREVPPTNAPPTDASPTDFPRESELAESERENQRLREQLGALRRRQEAELAELRRPQLNAPLYDILPQEMTVRSAAGDEVTRIELPPGPGSFTLILNGGGVPPYPSYDIEIRGRGGKKVWRGTGLRQEGGGNFVLALDRDFLRDGQYSLKLFRRSNEGSKAVAEYNITVSTRSRRERP
jgi:hypothetical protein